MNVPTPDSGLLGILLSVLRREYHQKPRGEERDKLHTAMALCLIGMGCAMLKRDFDRKQGRSGWSR